MKNTHIYTTVLITLLKLIGILIGLKISFWAMNQASTIHFILGFVGAVMVMLYAILELMKGLNYLKDKFTNNENK
jgi:zinc transporter ZupT